MARAFEPSAFQRTAFEVGLTIDDGTDWWAGVKHSFASVALAACVAASALSSQVAAQVYQQDDLPSAAAAAQIDEDYWRNSTAPAQAVNYQKLPYLQDAEEIPAGTLFGQADEDLWVNPVAPVKAANWQRLPYLPDTEESPAGSLFGQPDEDLWRNPVLPAQSYLFQPLPYSFDAGEFVTAATVTVVDEDFSQVSATVQVPWRPLYWFDTDDSLQWANFSVDEEQWNLAQRWAAVNGALYLFDSGEFQQSTTFQPDEDGWVAAPQPSQTANRALYLFDTDEIPQTAAFLPDEDFWIAPVQTRAPNQALYLFDSEALPSLTVDEDYWQPLPALKQTVFLLGPMDAGEFAAPQSIFSTPDEDFWFNQVRPVMASLFQRMPILPELADDVPVLSAPIPPVPPPVTLATATAQLSCKEELRKLWQLEKW